MNASNSPESNCPGSTDWHPADVLAALKKRGHSLAGLSVANGYHPTAAGKALKQPWPAMERLLAEAIGVVPWEIWPNRYDSEGNPRRHAKT
jgi:Ner family transcriptional regulator